MEIIIFFLHGGKWGNNGNQSKIEVLMYRTCFIKHTHLFLVVNIFFFFFNVLVLSNMASSKPTTSFILCTPLFLFI